MYVGVYLYEYFAPHTRSVQRGQKRFSGPLELELLAAMWVLGTEPMSSGRAAEPSLQPHDKQLFVFFF